MDETKVAKELNTQEFQIVRHEDDKHILGQFIPEQQVEIKHKQKILSSLAYYIGKDFEIPVKLNEPGKGWHWNFANNEIKVDPVDLLEKPFDYLRFVISHEGGHRRISRTEFIPMEVWSQPGFSFMMNSIEDPRDNNFVAENYHKFRSQMEMAYEHDLDLERKAKAKAREKLGYQPRFMQAGFEYIKQWYREVQEKEFELSADLPEDVREVVENTLESAQDSWWRYPSKVEADESEDLIRQYAQVSYEINLEDVWPEFKKLVEKDEDDQKMQEFMKDMQNEKAQGNEQSTPEKIKDKLTPEEREELESAIEKAIEEMKKGKKNDDDKKQEIGNSGSSQGENEYDGKDKDGAKEKEAENGQVQGNLTVTIDLDLLSDELKVKIRELMEDLPEEKKKELEDEAEKSLKEFDKDISDDLGGKLSDNPDKKVERGDSNEEDGENDNETEDNVVANEKEESKRQGELEVIRRKMEEIFESKDDNPYVRTLKEVAPLIDDLTGELRSIFIMRKIGKATPGHRFGRKWNIKKRIQERVEGVPLIRTESRERPESRSEEKDYAITLMVDLSGSMLNDGKIEEAFKSVIVLAETLQSLNIKFEIVGFQDEVLEFKTFDEELSDNMRNKLNQLPLEADDENPGGNNNAGDNDDGACLGEVSKSLAQRMEQNKFLIVLSDGEPAMDSGKKNSSQLNRELRSVVKNITQNTNQKLLGVGLLSDAVSNFYPNNIPNVTTEDLVETLGEVLRDMIENY